MILQSHPPFLILLGHGRSDAWLYDLLALRRDYSAAANKKKQSRYHDEPRSSLQNLDTDKNRHW